MLDHVQQAVDDDAAITEFPVTMEAAGALHEAGIRVLRGATNLARIRSSNGVVTARGVRRRELRVV